MTCYVVSADQALEDYRFIHQYEVILTAAFLVGMAILLWYLLRSNFLERRALLLYLFDPKGQQAGALWHGSRTG